MPVPNLVRAAPLRYALAFAAVAALVMGVLLAVVYWSMIGLLERHLDASIEQQRQLLADDFEQDGRDSLLGLVRQQARRSSRSSVRLLVMDGSGTRIAGNLPPLDAVEGWQRLDAAAMPSRDSDSDHEADHESDDHAPLRALGRWFDPNTFVLIARETEELAESRELILESFAWALGVTVSLALAGGLLIALDLLRRVNAASRSARAIMDGDLSRRIPVSRRGDELDRLADALNRMLARIQELVDNLQHVTSDLAHDLRTPLGRLRQRLEASRGDQRTVAGFETAIDAAMDDTDGIIRTFDAVLRIAQIESGRRRERFERIDLSAVVENVCEAYSAVAEDSDRRLVTSIETGAQVNGDSELLTQLLANLIENALRHTPQHTLVSVRLEHDHGRLVLAVGDNGPGIPEEEHERVFRRFYRLDRSRSMPGSGLGLSLVGAIARLHDASVVLEDNKPGLRVCIEFGGHRRR